MLISGIGGGDVNGFAGSEDGWEAGRVNDW